MALLAGAAFVLAPSTAFGQEAPPASTSPAPDTVGPKALQDFNLNGTVTHPADQPAATAPAAPKRQPPRPQAQSAPPSTQPAAATEQASSPPALAPAPAPPPVKTATTHQAPSAARPEPAPQALRQSAAPASVTVALPKLDLGTVKASAAAAPAPSPAFSPDPDPTPPGTLAPERNLSILPWLLAAIALGAGGAFLFWRNRSRHAFAGGPQIDAFMAPEPAPQPRPAPAPAAPPETQPAVIPGIVSTRLRPWIDIGFRPLRCVLDKEKVSVDFEIELFNSGSAPARAVLVEGTLFNAGATQDQEISKFFANPVGEGERIVIIPPLQRVAVRTQVAAPCSQLQAYELGGHQVFVPLIGFNALYRWTGGEGQTSASYLLGRDTKGEKMAPFRLDLGPRIFRAVGARLLPAAVRQ